MASQFLQGKRSEIVHDRRANAFIANKCDFRYRKIADNVTCSDGRNAVFHSQPTFHLDIREKSQLIDRNWARMWE
jgi:hypothetical protein